MGPDAYTVGNPEAYEPYMNEESNPMKAIGGVVFLSREEAEETVSSGFLPSEWFDGEILPGKVYGLLCDPENDVQSSEHGLSLARPAKLIRI